MGVVRTDPATFLGMSLEPFFKVGLNRDDTAPAGLVLLSVDDDVSLGHVDITPFKTMDLGSAESRKCPDGRKGDPLVRQSVQDLGDLCRGIDADGATVICGKGNVLGFGLDIAEEVPPLSGERKEGGQGSPVIVPVAPLEGVEPSLQSGSGDLKDAPTKGFRCLTQAGMAIRPVAVGTLLGFEIIQELLNYLRKCLRGYLPPIRLPDEECCSLHKGGLLGHLGHDFPGIDEFPHGLTQVHPEGSEHLVAEFQKGGLLCGDGADMRDSVSQLVGNFLGPFTRLDHAGALDQLAMSLGVVGEENLTITSVVNRDAGGLALVDFKGSFFLPLLRLFKFP